MNNDVKNYKCPYCGAEITFMPEAQNFHCDYCQSDFTLEDIKNQIDQNEKEDTAKQEFEDKTNLYNCPNCGAEIITDQNTAATFCYYCHNPVILKGRVSGELRPSKVLQFTLNRENAQNTFKEWSKKKWFAPSDFKSTAQLEKMIGLYVPFWITDNFTTADMDATCTDVKTWSDENYNYTKTDTYQVYRKAKIAYKGLPADGSSKIADDVMEAIEPFDYSKCVDFNMAYLSGFQAQKYDVGKTEIFPNIKKRVETANRGLLMSTMHYDSITENSFTNHFDKVVWNYYLMPVWFMTYKYKDEIYEYAINGETGKISGKVPLSGWKLNLFSAGLAIIIGLIIALIEYWFFE